MEDLISVNLRGFEIKIKLKSGVFSKDGVDKGSKLLIDNMEIIDGSLIADLGCGPGVIGIVAAKLNPDGHVHFLDEHLRSTRLAEENIELNHLKNAEVYISDLFSTVEGRSYQTILSNPPQHLGNDFLKECASQCFNHLKPKGKVYWVVQNHLKSVIERIFEEVFGKCEIVARGSDHIVLLGQRG